MRKDHMQQYLRCYTELPTIDSDDPTTTDRARRQGRRRQERKQQALEKKATARGATNSRTTAIGMSEEARAIRDTERPYGGYCLVMDTETTIDERKALRVGFYIVCGISHDEKVRLYRGGHLDRAALDAVTAQGVFYDPDELTADEVTTVTRWARDNGTRCMTAQEFVRTVFYEWVYTREALCIGHNLAFDLTRLAADWGAAMGNFRGGFTLKFCDCTHKQCFPHPSLSIKHVGASKNLYEFKASGRLDKSGKPIKGERRGHFIDTMTLGRALLGPGQLGLDGLAKRAGVPDDKRKVRWDGDHGGTITPVYLDYNSRDVYATWELYKQLRDEYRKHGVQKEIWHIISEASLGKAMYQAVGVPRFLTQHKDFPKGVIGHAMEAYYGGRSEVHIRLQPVDVIHCDFKSEYPTVNALMEMQDILIAEHVDTRDCTDDVRVWLHDHKGDMLTMLQQHSTWRLLRKLVKVKPNGDILPFRSTYNDGQAATNIGQQYVYGLPAWYTLADVIGSMIRTGRVPEIVEAVEIVPIGRVDTKPFTLLGDAANTIDLTRDDLFSSLIDKRDEIKAQEKLLKKDRRTATGQQYADIDARLAVLDSQQRALKLIANSTSYGVLLQILQDERTDDAKQVMCYDEHAHSGYTHYVEEPGPYFAGGVGTFIPAGGRLLLAIVEKLATDRGLSWAFADTDSMSFARPDSMPRYTFMCAVDEITEWFTPLSPYKSSAPIFVKEDYKDWQGEPFTLRCLAVSAKRYVLYNTRDDGTRRLRKFSAHGTGMWERLRGYVPNRAIDEQHWAHGEIDLLYAREDGVKVSECYANLDDLYSDRMRGVVYDNTYDIGGPRWLYDLWHSAIEQVEDWHAGTSAGVKGKSRKPRVVVEHNPLLDIAARQQVTFATAHVYNQFHKRIKECRPWSFMTTLPALQGRDMMFRRLTEQVNDTPYGELTSDWKAHAYDGLDGVTFYDAYDDADTPVVRRLDNGAIVTIKHKTYREVFAEYFNHPESKAADPLCIGTLERRHIVAVDHVYIGKETNEVHEDENEQTDGAVTTPDAQQYARNGLVYALKAHGVNNVMVAITDMGKKDIQQRTLYNYASGKTIDRKHVATLVAALDICQHAHGCCADSRAADTNAAVQNADMISSSMTIAG